MLPQTYIMENEMWKPQSDISAAYVFVDLFFYPVNNNNNNFFFPG